MKLREYLDTYSICMVDFCRVNNLNRKCLYAFMQGRSPTLKSAAKIVRATKGEVDFWDLLVEDENL